MSDLQRVALIIAVAIGLFLYIQVLCYLISWWSGWRTLLKRFRHDEPFYGRIFGWQSARMRWGANYNNALNLGADTSGLYLSTTWLVPQHPPLHIPWSEIKIVNRKKFLVWEFTYFTLGTVEQIPFGIRSELSDKLHKEAGRLTAS